MRSYFFRSSSKGKNGWQCCHFHSFSIGHTGHLMTKVSKLILIATSKTDQPPHIDPCTFKEGLIAHVPRAIMWDQRFSKLQLGSWENSSLYRNHSWVYACLKLILQVLSTSSYHFLCLKQQNKWIMNEIMKNQKNNAYTFQIDRMSPPRQKSLSGLHSHG